MCDLHEPFRSSRFMCLINTIQHLHFLVGVSPCTTGWRTQDLLRPHSGYAVFPHDIFCCCFQNPLKGIHFLTNLRRWLLSSNCHRASTLSLHYEGEKKPFESFNEIPLHIPSFYSSDFNRAFVSETKSESVSIDG